MTNTDKVLATLQGGNFATPETTALTGAQIRGIMTRLRKKGYNVAREPYKGVTRYYMPETIKV